MSLIIVFLLILLSTFLFMIFSTLLHELGHKRELKKNGIDAKIKFHMLKNIKNTFKGNNFFGECQFDEKKFNRLKESKRKNILLAGIKIDLILTFILLIAFLFICLFAYLPKDNLFVYTSLFIFAFIISQILKFFYNIFGKESDISRLKSIKLNSKKSEK